MNHKRNEENGEKKKLNKEAPDYGAMIIDMILNRATEKEKERLYHFVKNYLG